MKKVLLLLLCTVSVWLASAQGDCVKTGQKIGPDADYSVGTPNYMARGVKVYDGQRKLKQAEVKNLFRGSVAYDEYQRGLKYSRVGNALLWPGVAAVGVGGMLMLFSVMNNTLFRPFYGAGFLDSGGRPGLIFFCSGLPFLVTGAVFKGMAGKRVANAVSMYNDNVRNYSPELSIGFTPGGIGLVCKF